MSIDFSSADRDTIAAENRASTDLRDGPITAMEVREAISPTPKQQHGGSAWMQTVSGKVVHLLAPRPESIDIDDIGHHLSMERRWGGATREFYSVAQHSVHVAALVSPANRLWALLHDASEAYLGDVTARFKASDAMAGYRAVESQLQRQIYHRFGLRGDEPAEIHEADILVRVREAHDLLISVPDGMQDLKPAPFRIHPWDQARAKRVYLRAFEVVTKELR